MRFVAVDVETANADWTSICQIGMCLFEDGEETDGFSSLVRPVNEFDERNTAIHGLTMADVADAPSFLSICGAIRALARDAIIVSHGHFDRHALTKAFLACGAGHLDAIWLDGVALSRWAWPEQGDAGFGLAALADKLGIEFMHHDATEDARAAGKVALAAMSALGITLSDAVKHHGQRSFPPDMVPSGPSARTYAARPNIRGRDFSGGDGPLAGQRIVFTGALATPRPEAAARAAALGAHCSESVSMKTTILVIGNGEGDRPVQTLSHGIRLTTSMKSGKHVKAERLIAQGALIKIMEESEFVALCEQLEAGG